MRRVVPWSRPEERIGYGEIELNRGDPYYDDVLRHIAGLLPGQTKPVPPWRADEKWHCTLDPCSRRIAHRLRPSRYCARPAPTRSVRARRSTSSTG
jgi:hypothetical protein